MPVVRQHAAPLSVGRWRDTGHPGISAAGGHRAAQGREASGKITDIRFEEGARVEAGDLVRTKAPRTQCEDQGALAKVIRCLVEYTDVLDSEICSTGFVINQHYVGLNEFVG